MFGMILFIIFQLQLLGNFFFSSRKCSLFYTDDCKVSGECFIDTDTDLITSLCWPAKVVDKESFSEGETLLVGCVNGVVSWVTVKANSFVKEELAHCSQPNGKNCQYN